MKMSKLVDVLSKKVTAIQMYHKRGFGGRASSRRRLWGPGAKPPAAGQFFIIKKKSYFNTIGLHFARIQRPI